VSILTLRLGKEFRVQGLGSSVYGSGSRIKGSRFYKFLVEVCVKGFGFY
jgi:hypothetical protein